MEPLCAAAPWRSSLALAGCPPVLGRGCRTRLALAHWRNLFTSSSGHKASNQFRKPRVERATGGAAGLFLALSQEFYMRQRGGLRQTAL